MDASSNVLNQNYPACLTIQAGARSLFSKILDQKEKLKENRMDWEPFEITRWRECLNQQRRFLESRIHGLNPPTGEAFFAALRKVLPKNACLVTDSGLHQFMVRRHFQVLSSKGLMIPTDYQSMGFGIPAGIGAKLSSPEKTVVVVVGDGGFALTGLECATAVRENIQLIVILFSDNYLGLVRLNQFKDFGRCHTVKTGVLHYEKLCDALGMDYYALDRNIDEIFDRCLGSNKVSLIEVKLEDSLNIHRAKVRGFVTRQAHRFNK